MWITERPEGFGYFGRRSKGTVFPRPSSAAIDCVTSSCPGDNRTCSVNFLVARNVKGIGAKERSFRWALHPKFSRTSVRLNRRQIWSIFTAATFPGVAPDDDGFTGYQPTSGRDVEPPATPANKQDSVLFPSVGVNAEGKAVIVFSVAGEDFFPSAAYEQ